MPSPYETRTKTCRYYRITGEHCMKPNAEEYKDDPKYIRELIDRTGMTQEQVAHTLGLSLRAIKSYITGKSSITYRQAPYTVQFALECLVQSIEG